MGTRGVYGVRVNGVDKLMYNGYDSYPHGLGVELVRQITTMIEKFGAPALKNLAATVRLVNPTDVPSPGDLDNLRGHMGSGLPNGDGRNWNDLLRPVQGDLKTSLLTGYMLDNHEFIMDSLFCEYGYIFDLDKNRFEVYQGFQKDPHDKGPYADLPPYDPGYRSTIYYPCAMVFAFPLDRIPENWVDLAFPREDEDEGDTESRHSGPRVSSLVDF
mgnify:CR=1 FL=1